MDRIANLVSFGTRGGATEDSGFLAETTLGGWLRKVAGYEDINKAVLKPKSFPGRRDWFEVEHAQTGETCVFHCSESGGHTHATVRQRGASLRMVCRKTNGGNPWWFTAEDGTGGAETGASFTLGSLTSEPAAESSMTEPVL